MLSKFGQGLLDRLSIMVGRTSSNVNAIFFSSVRARQLRSCFAGWRFSFCLTPLCCITMKKELCLVPNPPSFSTTMVYALFGSAAYLMMWHPMGYHMVASLHHLWADLAVQHRRIYNGKVVTLRGNCNPFA